MNKTAKIAGSGVAALFLALSLSIASPATAVSAAPASVAHAAPGVVKTALSPTCVDVTKQGRSKGFPYVDVKNKCSSTQRVKVLWASAPDSSCNTLKPGQSFRDSTGVFGVFDGLRKC